MRATYAEVRRSRVRPNYIYDPSGNITVVAGTNTVSPSISIKLESALLCNNNCVSFSVAATGVGVSYRLFSSGVPIFGATSDTVILPNSTSINGGFCVIINNGFASATSSPAGIWVASNGSMGLSHWREINQLANSVHRRTGASDCHRGSIESEPPEKSEPGGHKKIVA